MLPSIAIMIPNRIIDFVVQHFANCAENNDHNTNQIGGNRLAAP